MRTALVALLFVVEVNGASAQTAEDVWLVSIDRREPMGTYTAAYFIDANRIEVVVPYRRAWNWVLYAPNSPTRSAYSETISLNEYDCRQKRIRVVQSTTYLRAGGTHNDPRTDEWDYVIPNTQGEALLEFVCETPLERVARPEYLRLEGLTREEVAERLFRLP